MNDVMKDATAIVMAIVGVALLTVLVSKGNQTPTVISAATGGLGNLLQVAMGGTNSSIGVGMMNG